MDAPWINLQDADAARGIYALPSSSYGKVFISIIGNGCTFSTYDVYPGFIFCYTFLIGKLISVIVKKHDCLPGLLTLYLEYFDTVKQMKEEIYLDKNMKVPPQQQQLFFEEKSLDDHLTLSQCGIQNGSQVIIRGK